MIELEIDSNEEKTIELNNLSGKQMKEVINIMSSNNCESVEYKERMAAQAIISYVSEKEHSIGIKILGNKYFDFIKLLEKKLQK